MSIEYNYTRDRKKIFVFNGFFDPSQDSTQMTAKYEKTWRTSLSPITYSVVSSPGGAGDFSHKFTGNIDTTRNVVNDRYFGQISPYRGNIKNKQLAFPIYSPLKWKMRSEFRLYIEADKTSSETAYKLATSAVFGLDGCTISLYDQIGFPAIPRFHLNRICVAFNVAASLAGITSAEKFDAAIKNLSDNKTIHSVAWAGSYNTWYDVRIEWEFDFYTAPLIVPVTVYINKSLIFTYNVPLNNWRVIQDSKGNPDHQKNNYNAFLGRPAFGANYYGRATHTTGALTCYFKDILITTDELKDPIEWQFNNGIIKSNLNTSARFMYSHDDPKALAKGSDIQLWFRETASDSWNGIYRGKVKETNRLLKRFVIVDTEGYDSLFSLEIMDDITLTTKTTSQIFVEAIDNPPKYNIFDSSTYFDSVSNTYTRGYKQVPKMDIFLEMGALEGFLSLLDIDKNFHYQKPRTNQTGVHLIYGSSKIFDYNLNHIDIRKPNIVRVIGSGVISEREILGRYFESETTVVTTINKPDLTTQSDVDDASEYYASLYRDDIRILEINLRKNWDLTYGSIVTITIPNINIQATKFVITDIFASNTGLMKLTLLEAKPNIALVFSDLSKRTERSETLSYEADTKSGLQDRKLEDTSTLLVSATYEVEFSSVVVRSGNLTLTDEFIDDLLEKWNNDAPTKPSHIEYGSGSTEPTYEDTALETAITRVAASLSQKDKIEEYISFNKYRSTEYEISSVANTTISEIGLFNAAGGGTMAGRAVFNDYTFNGTITIRIRISFDTEPGSTYVTYRGITTIAQWLYDNTWSNISFIYLAGESLFHSPHPQITNLSESIETSRFYWRTQSTGAFTKTLFKHRDEILYSITGTYPTLGMMSAAEVGIVLSDAVSRNTATKEYHIVGLRQNPANIGTLADFTFTYRIFLKILRAEVVYN